MNKQLLKLCVVAFAFSGIANANHEGAKWPATSGSFQGGLGYSWVTGGADGFQMVVDGLNLKNRFEVSPKLSVIVHNAFAMNSGSNGGGAGFNGSNYFSSFTLGGAAAGTANFAFSNLAAYIQHECSKTITMAFGHMRTGLGMESMWDRSDMPTYYYSFGYTLANSATANMNYDMALKFSIHDVVPGTLEVALLDGRAGRGVAGKMGGLAARWHHEIKSGDTTITPVVSTVMENWAGGPKDFGLTAGAMTKFSSFWLNAEFFFLDTAVLGNNWHIMAEPGFDLGMFDVSVKYNFVNSKSVTDHMLGAAISKTYDDKYTVKLAYNHAGLSGKVGGHLNDIRLLFSTKW